MKYRFFSLWMEFPIAKLKLTVQTRIVREKIHRYQFSILFIGTRSLNGAGAKQRKFILSNVDYSSRMVRNSQFIHLYTTRV